MVQRTPAAQRSRRRRHAVGVQGQSPWPSLLSLPTFANASLTNCPPPAAACSRTLVEAAFMPMSFAQDPDLIAGVYAAAAHPDRWNHAWAAVCHAFEAENGVLFEQDDPSAAPRIFA